MINHKKYLKLSSSFIFILLFLIVLTTGLLTAHNNDDDDDDDYEEENSSVSTNTAQSNQNLNVMYAKECGECHFAFQPGLLPSRSWQLMFSDKNLEDHFGEFLEYDPPTKKVLLTYLNSNSADKSGSRLSSKMTRSLSSSETPLRITELWYFKREHADIPAQMITGNKDVKTISNCSACHLDAESGAYRERRISIPNYPNYDH